MFIRIRIYIYIHIYINILLFCVYTDIQSRVSGLGRIVPRLWPAYRSVPSCGFCEDCTRHSDSES